MKALNQLENSIFKYLAVTIVLLAVTIFLAGMAFVLYKPAQSLANTNDVAIKQLPVNQQILTNQARIQLAILLDTSSSMDGLIDQARNQLWQVINEFSQTRKNGLIPVLEVAIYEYGNSTLSSETGYIRQMSGLTRDLDKVSEALFSLTTNGGDEYCGYVINKAVTELQWSDSADDIKAIFIAGNEAFSQGPVAYRQAVNLAKNREITVNTIHAGEYNEGVRSGWQEGAVIAGGNYMSIDHNHHIVHIAAPQDQKIANLNRQLNATYVPYGQKGDEGARRQSEQDDKNNDISIALLVNRVKTKISSFYDNSDWDLVDAISKGSTSLESIAITALPDEMKELNERERQDYVMAKTDERRRIKQEIEALSKDRSAHIAEAKSQAAETEVTTINDALTAAIRDEGRKKNFVFQEN